MQPDEVAVDFDMYPFSDQIKEILRQHGLLYRSDFAQMKARDLVSMGIELQDARFVLRIIQQGPSSDLGESAFDRYHVHSTQRIGPPHVLTFCQAFDAVLGGGFERGSVTEVCGVPGIGKTQLSMQLSLCVQLPRELGGLGGECVVVDTEGSFMPQRLDEMAQAFIKHVNRLLVGQYNRSQQQPQDPSLPSSAPPHQYTSGDLLGRVHLMRLFKALELVSFVNSLRTILSENRNVKLVVIDSITFQFRFEFEDMAIRARLLSGISQRLSELATEFDVAVVVVNQLTTKIDPRQAGSAHLTPALGHTWAHACKNRVLLFWKGDHRCALLYKSPSRRPAEALYDVTNEGIRDVNRKRTREQAGLQ